MDYNEVMSTRGKSYTTFENIEELLYNGTDDSNIFLQIISSCSDLFLATTIEPFSGEENITLNSPIFSSIAIFKDFIYENYGDLYCRYEFLKHNEEQAITQSRLLERVYNYCVAFHDSNYYKYTGLIDSLNKIYNPIENYNMVEDGDDDTEYKGTETNSKEYSSNVDDDVSKSGSENTARTISTDNISYAEMNGPLTSGSISGGNVNLVFNTDGKVTTKAIDGSDNTTNGLSVIHQTSTDDSDVFRNESKDNTIGGSQTTNPLMGKMSSGSPNAFGYTDTTTYTDPKEERDITTSGNETNTKSFTGRTDNVDHHLERSGNIGVTTTQQMLDQERKIRMFNVAKVYCDELFSGLALNVWR